MILFSYKSLLSRMASQLYNIANVRGRVGLCERRCWVLVLDFGLRVERALVSTLSQSASASLRAKLKVQHIRVCLAYVQHHFFVISPSHDHGNDS